MSPQANSPTEQAFTLAVLSDLHANLGALAAVRAELARLKPDAVVVLGDLVGYLTRPNQVVAQVQAAGWPCLAGNYDLAVLTGGEAGIEQYLKPGIGLDPRAVFAHAEGRVNDSTRRYLGSLPSQIQMRIAGRSVLACHGSPEHVRQYVHPDHPQEDLDRLVSESGAEVVLMGHTHRPMVRPAGGGLAVNPGSVGKPKDGDPRASLALVRFDQAITAEIVRVEYDLEAEAALLRAEGFPAMSLDKLYAGL